MSISILGDQAYDLNTGRSGGVAFMRISYREAGSASPRRSLGKEMRPETGRCRGQLAGGADPSAYMPQYSTWQGYLDPNEQIRLICLPYFSIA